MELKSIENANISKGTKVLVRADLNVPMQDSAISDCFRIEKILPTLNYLQEKGAQVIVISHLEKGSLELVYEEMKKNIPITFATNRSEVSEMQDGDIVLLENLRLDNRETECSDLFAKELSFGMDVFVFEAFSVAHRLHTSTSLVQKYLPTYAGFLFHHEIIKMKQLINHTNPSLAVLGGAKIETKLPLLEKLLNGYDKVFVGGIMANVLLKAKGFPVGDSVVEECAIPNEILSHPSLVLPSDVVVLRKGEIVLVSCENVGPEDKIIDVGPESIKNLSNTIAKAGTVLWNGPLGFYEEEGGKGQSILLSSLVGSSSAVSVVGGGHTVSLLRENKREGDWSHVSTGGGAMLYYLMNETFPVLES